MIIVVVAALALVSVGAAAAKTKVFEFTDAGFRLSWSKGVKIKQREGNKDLIYEGSHGAVQLKVIVRKGERLPEAQHEFRLMSYFAGHWAKAEADCRGTGWDGCTSWNWDSESGDRAGVGEVGYGPGGTYIFVLSAPEASFKQHRPKMRIVQQSVQLF
jgi:hypothetical protein